MDSATYRLVFILCVGGPERGVPSFRDTVRGAAFQDFYATRFSIANEPLRCFAPDLPTKSSRTVFFLSRLLDTNSEAI